jgi:predicted  nucleic acid-binding Zn-ribbon protein
MDPLDMAMAQMQQMATITKKQTLLNKHMSALDLTRIESEIDVARARADVADAEIRTLQVRLAHSESDGEAATDYIKALIAAVTAERDARLNEVKALESCFEVKKEMAELTLAVDPNLMNRVVAMLDDPFGDASDGDADKPQT